MLRWVPAVNASPNTYLVQLACRVPAVNASPVPEQIARKCSPAAFVKRDNLAHDRCGIGLRARASNRKAGKKSDHTAWTDHARTGNRNATMLLPGLRLHASPGERIRPRFAMAPKTRRERKCTNSVKISEEK